MTTQHALPTAGRRLLSEPTVPILLLAGVVQVARRSVADIVLFLGMAVVVVWDARRRIDPGEVRPRWRVPTGLPLLLLATGFALAVAIPSRSSPWLDVSLAVPGALALVAVLSTPAGPPPGPSGTDVDRSRGWLAWPLLALCLAVLELGAFLSQASPTTPNPDHPTVSTTVEPLLDGRPVRAVVLFVWFLTGAWLARAVREESR